jgi:hypothetical protein
MEPAASAASVEGATAPANIAGNETAQEIIQPTPLGNGAPVEESGVNAETGLQTPPTSEPGMMGKAWDWVNKKPINTLIAAQGVSGLAQGAMGYEAQRRQEKQQRDLLEQQHQNAIDQADLPRRQKQGNPSVGGGQTNINVRPVPGRVLLRPDGTPVFVPGTGIINNYMTGVRG